MLDDGRRSAGIRAQVCHDQDEGCGNWALEGLCRENAAFMLRVCPAACGICTEFDTPPKDEL